MKVSVTTQVEDNYVLLKVVGEVNQSPDWKSLAALYALDVFKNNVKKIVIDSLELIIPQKTQFSLGLIHNYVDSIPLELMYFNIAVVIKKDYQELGRLWKIACNNRGFEGFNVFYDLNEAIEWIKGQ